MTRSSYLVISHIRFSFSWELAKTLFSSLTAGLSDRVNVLGIAADCICCAVLRGLPMTRKRLYYEHPVPYGGWALSLVVLLRVFFWFKGEDAGSTSSSAGETESGAQGDDASQSEGEAAGEHWGGEGTGEGHRSWGHTSSSAYQTDEEVCVL